MNLPTVLTCMVLFAPIAVGLVVAPASGFVPDANTAIKIAEAVLIPVYGEKTIESERPFKAE